MKPETQAPYDGPVREHSFDGIQEYDKRLPNWWLFTLYGAIVFAIVFWWVRMDPLLTPSDQARVTAAMARIEAAKLSSAGVLTDDTLWAMSRNPVITAAGKATFNSNCVACHLASLRGKDESPTAIGPNLTDQIWIHGGKPTQILATATGGVPAKGMPTWGPLLGTKKLSEVIAYVLSYHQPGEPVIDAAAVAAGAPR